MVKPDTILVYLLSFIGIKPITEQQQQQQEQEQEDVDIISTSNYSLVSSVIQHYTNPLEFQDWLSQLSKMALRQILATTIADYPQIADGIYHRHYEKSFKKKKVILYDKEEELDVLKSIQWKARQIAHQYDKLRRSDQFTKAPEIAVALEQLVKTIHMKSDQSFIALFSIIILTQESILAPSEIRQHIFYQAKFGRILILEMSSILKNFKFSTRVVDFSFQSKKNWFQALEDVCTKLSHYDPTWEHRKEYQEVVIMAERLYLHH